MVEAALAQGPGERALSLKRSAYLHRLGRGAEALPALAALLGDHPGDAEIMLALAQAQAAAGGHAAGLALCDAVLAAKPTHRRAMLARIEALQALRRLPEALAATEAGLARQPGERQLTLKRGSLLGRLDRAAEAVALLHALWGQHPRDADVALALAHAHRLAGDHVAVHAMVEAALQAAPGHHRALAARIDDAMDRNDMAALTGLARQLFARLDEAQPGEAAGQLARILPRLDRAQWQDELWRWIDRIADHAALVEPGALWALHDLATLQGLTRTAERLLGAILDKPMLSATLAKRLLRWALGSGAEAGQRLAPLLRARVPPALVPVFDLEYQAIRHGADAALRARLRRPGRPAEEILALVELLVQHGRRGLAHRYLSLARRHHPDHAGIRQRHLAALAAGGDATQGLATARALLAGKPPPTPQDFAAAITGLVELGEAEAALGHIEATPDLRNRRHMRVLHLQLLVRFGHLAAAKALAAEVASLGRARRALHFGPTLDGLRLIELELAAPSSSAPGALVTPYVGPSVLTIDRFLATPAPRPPADQAPDDRIPRRIVQYWSHGTPPPALAPIMASWRAAPGHDYALWDRRQALAFLADEFGTDWARALRLARHPAEESDFFRLCYLSARGGIYADCDDRLTGPIERLRRGASGLVVFREPMGTIANNLILAAPHHPVLALAAVTARQALTRKDNDSVWAKTGPGLLTRVIAQACEQIAKGAAAPDFTIRPRHAAARDVHFHIPLPYKETQAYWDAPSRPTARNRA